MASDQDRAALIRSWLMAGQRPHTVVVTDTKGMNTRCPYTQGTTWITFARTVDALDPARIQCMNEAGELLKATTMNELEKIDDDEEDAPIPVIAEPVVDTSKMTGTEQLLSCFAGHLAAAYKGANETAWNTAFSKIVEVCDIFANRADVVENRLARMESMFARATTDTVNQGGEGNLLTDIIGAYASGMGASAAQKGVPTNGAAAKKPNGKGDVI